MSGWSFGAGTTPAPAGRLPLGAVLLGDGRCSFSVWAPRAEQVLVRFEKDRAAPRLERLAPAAGGYHEAVLEGCAHGDRYRLLVDGQPLADPASRWQPEGAHGPSAVVDLTAHRWHDRGFVPAPSRDHVIYELHVGTFTPEGTFAAAIAELDALVELGVTAVEPMPIAQFPGRRNWGYDGVLPFAVQHSYGGPVAFQRFVDACHRRGLAVLLDVVYNHLGPEPDVLPAIGPYVSDRRTPWGPALNFDGEGSDEVRRYFVENALGWLSAFHVDGLRLDAVHRIVDSAARPFLAELAEAVADASAVLGRRLLLIAESADNDPRVLSPTAAGGLGMDAQWNDDFHHALHALVTGERFGCYRDFDRVDQLARAMAAGFVHHGEHSDHRRRGHSAVSGGIDPERFVVFAQNHDQVGNRPRGDRLSTLVDRQRLRLVAAVLLLSPGIPLLFMGEEYGETAPFPYFVDHRDPGLLESVRRGRAEELAAGRADEPYDLAAGRADEPYDLAAEQTFARAVLDRRVAERPEGAALRALHGRLIALRRHHPALRRSAHRQSSVHTAGPVLTVLRAADPEAVVVLYNFGDHPAPALLPEPAPRAMAWSKLLDSADPSTGGEGEPLPATATDGTPLILGPTAFCAYWGGIAGARSAEPGCGATGGAGREPGAGGRR